MGFYSGKWKRRENNKCYKKIFISFAAERPGYCLSQNKHRHRNGDISSFRSISDSTINRNMVEKCDSVARMSSFRHNNGPDVQSVRIKNVIQNVVTAELHIRKKRITK